MVLAALVMVPTVWLPDLKSLSYLGFAGITATSTVTAAVAYTLLTGAHNHTNSSNISSAIRSADPQGAASFVLHEGANALSLQPGPSCALQVVGHSLLAAWRIL